MSSSEQFRTHSHEVADHAGKDFPNSAIFKNLLQTPEFSLLYQEAYMTFSSQMNKQDRITAKRRIAGALFEIISFHYLQQKAGHTHIFSPFQTTLFADYLVNDNEPGDRIVSGDFNLYTTQRIVQGYCPDGMRVDSKNRVVAYEYTTADDIERLRKKINQARWFQEFLRRRRPEYNGFILHLVRPKDAETPVEVDVYDFIKKTIYLPFTKKDFVEFTKWLHSTYRPEGQSLTLNQLQAEAHALKRIIVFFYKKPRPKSRPMPGSDANHGAVLDFSHQVPSNQIPVFQE